MRGMRGKLEQQKNNNKIAINRLRRSLVQNFISRALTIPPATQATADKNCLKIIVSGVVGVGKRTDQSQNTSFQSYIVKCGNIGLF